MKLVTILALTFPLSSAWSMSGRWRPVEKLKYDVVFSVSEDRIVCETADRCTIQCRVKPLDATLRSLEISDISSSGWPPKASFSEVRLFLEVRAMRKIPLAVVPEGDQLMTVLWKFKGKPRMLKLEKILM